MIVTERLELVPATIGLVQAALDGAVALAASLHATVSPGWPPEYLDAAALEFIRNRLTKSPEETSWWMYFAVIPGGTAPRILIGSVGYKGPPSADGTVEVGYGIVVEYQRHGYASEAVRGLVGRAFAEPSVARVIAETYPTLIGSIGVLQKCGFRLIGDGSEPGVIRFELLRAEHPVESAPMGVGST